MRTDSIFTPTHAAAPAGPRLVWGMALLFMTGGWAQAQSTQDSLDRSLDFVDKTAQATELFNSDQTRAALDLFRQMATNYPDLDEDGYVGLSIGDCLAALGEYDQARTAYAALLAGRPDLQSKVEARLVDAELLSGTISDGTLARLRAEAAGTQDGDTVKSRMRLAWALEKRAHALLAEAASLFRSISQVGWVKGDNESSRHALLLEEINQDLARLMAQTDALFGSRTLPQCDGDSEDRKSAVRTERRRVECVLRTPDGKRFELQIRRAQEAGAEEILVNGRSLELSEDEARLIQRHQDRINALLAQAAARATER